jgi:hypothetical protein
VSSVQNRTANKQPLSHCEERCTVLPSLCLGGHCVCLPLLCLACCLRWWRVGRSALAFPSFPVAGWPRCWPKDLRPFVRGGRGAELSRCSNNAGRLERSLPKRRAHGHGRARAREHGSWRRGGRRAGGTARPALARGKGREGNPTRRRRGRHRQASRQATQTRAHRVLHQNGCLGTRSPVPPACVPH